MGKVELGVKLTCDSCGARFYDLNKQPAKCPKCQAVNSRPVVFKAPRRGPTAEDRDEAKRAAAAAAAKPAVPAEDEEIEAAEVDDDEDEAVIEDTSDLGEDDDDVEVPVADDN